MERLQLVEDRGCKNTLPSGRVSGVVMNNILQNKPRVTVKGQQYECKPETFITAMFLCEGLT